MRVTHNLAPTGIPESRWYAPAAVLRRATTFCCLAAALVATGCGGGTTQGANQVKGSGTYTVAVPITRFPVKQHLDSGSVLRIAVTNTGTRPLPDVGVTITTGNAGTSAPAFQAPSSQQGLAQRYQPIWVLDEGPLNGDAAVSNSWMLGNLPVGRTKIFTWRVHPIRSGAFRIRWRVLPAQLGGTAVLASGAAAEGVLPVVISSKAPAATVGANGKVKTKF